MNLFFFFFRSAWLRDLTHFVYARVKEKELERSDGVLLFLPLIERSASHSFRFFRFSFVFFCSTREFSFLFESGERGLEFLCTRKKKERWDQRKKRRGHGTKNEQILSLSERTNTISHHFSRQIIKEWD